MQEIVEHPKNAQVSVNRTEGCAILGNMGYVPHHIRVFNCGDRSVFPKKLDVLLETSIVNMHGRFGVVIRNHPAVVLFDEALIERGVGCHSTRPRRKSRGDLGRQQGYECPCGKMTFAPSGTETPSPD